MRKFFVMLPSSKAFEVFLLMGMVLTAVLVYGGAIANPITVILVSLGLTLLFMLLYLIGFYDEFQGWDDSWRGKVENSQLMVFSSVCTGIFAVFGTIWVAIKAVINKGEEFKNPTR